MTKEQIIAVLEKFKVEANTDCYTAPYFCINDDKFSKIADEILALLPNKKPSKTFIPPTISEVKDYFKSKGYMESAAIKAYEYYDAANWVDGKGQKVLNWKQKCIGVWFKNENKITEEKKGGMIF